METTMRRAGIFKLELESAMPVYLQLAEKILCAWVSGTIKPGELLPSLHEMSTLAEVSRGTVERAYGMLKEMEVISSHQGKGYFFRKNEGSMLLDKLRSITHNSI